MDNLTWADYLVFVVFLVVSIFIGVYYACSGGKQRTTGEFFLGNRSLKVLPTTLSMMVSYQSAIMMLGNTNEMYTRGVVTWPYLIMTQTIALILTERIFLPWLYPMKMTSVYEYLQYRFNSKVCRIVGSILGVLAGILYMGSAIYAPSVALEAATGFPLVASIPIMAIVSVLYTAMGGIKAVIITDVFQYVVMMSGMLAVLIKANLEVGGFGEAFEEVNNQGRIFWDNYSINPQSRHQIWSQMIGFMTNWCGIYAVNQASVQRYCSTGSLNEARMVLLLIIPFLAIMQSIACLTGVTVTAYFSQQGRDPLASQQINSGNQILPLFVMQSFGHYKGFTGFFLATLYSGALSSISSSLSGAAANTWEDIIKGNLGEISEFKATIINKILVAVFGVAATGIAFLSAFMPGPISQVSMAFTGATGGPLFGMFLAGGLIRRAEWKGVVCGSLMGIAFNIWLGLGSMSVKNAHPILPPVTTDSCNVTVVMPSTNSTVLYGLNNLYAVSYEWYAPIGASITIIVALIISCIPSGDKREELPDYMYIDLRSMCKCTKQSGVYDLRNVKSITKVQKEISQDVTTSTLGLKLIEHRGLKNNAEETG